jgi:hypothetical protein
MRLTLGKAKEALADHAPADKLEDRINRAIERILVSGKFMGGMDRIALYSTYGDITLPRRYRTVEGVKIDRDQSGYYTVRPITNGWFEFLEGKQTLADVNRSGAGLDTVRSLGDGHAIMHDLPVGGTLQSTAGGTPYTLTIYGQDSEGMPKIQVLTNVSPNVANTFTRITRIHKEQTDFVVRLKHSDGTNLTDLAIMEPSEEETYLRRYRDDALTSVPAASVLAFVKVRHLETTSDDDVLPISNITALGFEMDSLHYKSENDHAVADAYHNDALNLLNEELRDSHSVDEIPGLRFHYPGGPPNLTSRY